MIPILSRVGSEQWCPQKLVYWLDQVWPVSMWGWQTNYLMFVKNQYVKYSFRTDFHRKEKKVKSKSPGNKLVDSKMIRVSLISGNVGSVTVRFWRFFFLLSKLVPCFWFSLFTTYSLFFYVEATLRKRQHGSNQATRRCVVFAYYT